MNTKIRFSRKRLARLTQAGLMAFTAAMLLTVSVAGNAQTVASAIRGTVTDTTGNGVPSASITITHTPTGTRSVVHSDQDGNFLASGLRVGGPFSIQITADDFQGANYENVQLAVANTLQLDVELSSDSIEEVIVIGTAVAAVNTSGASSNFDLEFIEGSANFNRDLKDIIKRNPFAVILPGSEAPLSIAGANPAFNNLTIDGVRQNDDFGLNDNGYPSQRSPISLETVEQLSVEISPFSPRYGGFSGGHINVVTKSGTNQFHGSVFYENIDSSRSGTPTTPDGDKVDLEFEEESYGGFISGPIIKDKLFFLASYEYFETPLSVEWGPSGSGAPNEANVTEADMQEVIDIAQSVYGVNAGSWNEPRVEEDEKIFLKLDWNISDNHRAAFSYQRTEGNATSNKTSSRFELRLSSHWYNRGELLESYAGHLFSNWTDRFSTEIKLVDKSVENLQAPSDLTWGDTVIQTASGDVAMGPDHSRHANHLNNSTFQFTAHGIYDLGDHAIGFGVDYQDLDIFNVFAQTALGDFEFDSADDFRNRLASDFAYKNAYTNNSDDAAASFSYSTMALYIQDSWQITDTFQLDFGVRYETYSASDAPTENPNFEQRYGFSNTENLDGADDVLPRLGFEWGATDRMRVYGGLGKYGGGRPNVWIANSYSNDGVTYTQFDEDAIDSDLYLVDVDVSVIPQEVQDSMAPGNGNVNAIQPGFTIPSDWRYKLGVEYVFGDNWISNFDVILIESDTGQHWTDLARVDSGATTSDGGRIIYEPIDQLTGLPTNRHDLVLRNAAGGSSTVMSLSLAKTFDNGFGFYTSYANQDTDEGNPGTSSTAGSNYQFNATLDRQYPTFGAAAYDIEHRLSIDLRYRHAFFGEYDTRFNLFFQRRSGVPFSWAMGAFRNGALGDQSDFDDSDYYLPYIPTGASDPNVVYDGTTYEEFATHLELAGLTKYAGGYAAKNSDRTPWVTQIDLRIEQEIPGFSADHRGIFYLEVLNLYNLIDSDKGKVLQNRFRSSSRILADYDITATGQYEYSEPFGGWQTDANWDEFVAEESQWRLKLGVRYRF